MNNSLVISLLALGAGLLPACDDTTADGTMRGDSLRGRRSEDAAVDDADAEAARVCVADAECSGGEECDDGYCKAHGGRGENRRDGGGLVGFDALVPTSANRCNADLDCAGGEECDDGYCKPHGGRGDDDHGGNDRDDDRVSGGTACALDLDCAGGEECDDGYCKAHGGGSSGNSGRH
jgi:hypothetical protein